jgi:hypothetical protein
MSKRKRRLGLLAAPVVIALALASSAIAGITPLFSATTTADATVVSYSQLPGDDPIAALTFFVPVDYAALLAQPEGETVGTVTASAIAADLANTPLSLKGTIVAASATTTITSGGASVALGTAATACTGTSTHGAYWVLNLSAAGQTLQVPAFVDDVPITVPLAAIANNTITICLPPPDVPVGTPGRASLGAKLVSATLSITDVFSAAPAWYTWHTRITPYTPGTGKVNAAGTIEVQSLDKTPQVLTVKAKKKKPGKVTVSGRLVAGGKGVSGISVTILAGKKTVGKATTKAGGYFAALVTAPGTAKFSASVAVAPKKNAACAPYFAPAPCAGSWVAGFTAKSTAVKAS